MTLNLPTSELIFERRGPQGEVGWVTFNRPQARNALTFAIYEGVHNIVQEANGDRSLRALVFTGAGGRAFAAGTDIAQFQGFSSAQDALDYEARMDHVLGALEAARMPTLAAVQGACTGGGAGIACACDLRVAAPSARFGFPIARTLGNTLSMGNLARLVALIGLSRTKDLLLTARLWDAAEGLAAGLFCEVTETEGALPARAEELALALAGHAPLTLETLKEGLRRVSGQFVPEAGGSDLVVRAYTSRDFQEGVRAFLDRRPPEWRGK